MDKDKAVFPDKGIWPVNEKEQSVYICYNKDELQHCVTE
jgi:hypothetical protein